MSTDERDINSPSFANDLFQKYFPDITSSTRVLMLLMSRRNQFVKMVASKPLMPLITQQKMLEMIGAGAPSLRAKKGRMGSP
jgi:hypothetical protein